MSNLSRKEAKKMRQDGLIDINAKLNNRKFAVMPIQMKGDNQAKAFSHWNSGVSLNLHGTAGTGKTFLALFFALTEMLTIGSVDKVYIVRSTVSSRDPGALPGTNKDKIAPYEAPYIGLCAQLMGRDDAYAMLKQAGKLEFVSTGFIRGTEWNNAVIIVDECQNMSPMELHTVFTRVGVNSRFIFAGDSNQDDLTSKRFNEVSGFPEFVKILDSMEEFGDVEFNRDDIVRSGLLRSYIIAREELGL